MVAWGLPVVAAVVETALWELVVAVVASIPVVEISAAVVGWEVVVSAVVP